VLRATRLDAVSDRFLFRIVAPACVPVTTTNRKNAAEALRQLGVSNAMHFVEHVETWGEVEIVTPDQG
jgi:hypothetical protein